LRQNIPEVKGVFPLSHLESNFATTRVLEAFRKGGRRIVNETGNSHRIDISMVGLLSGMVQKGSVCESGQSQCQVSILSREIASRHP
jgi:hypothetical protein